MSISTIRSVISNKTGEKLLLKYEETFKQILMDKLDDELKAEVMIELRDFMERVQKESVLFWYVYLFNK